MILDRLGVRVSVLQVREGRILVQCTGCLGENKGAEGWMPRGVLWSGPSPNASTKDPLSLALNLRGTWKSAPPEGLTAAEACAIADSGWKIEPNQATAEASGGKIILQREGANWRMSEARAPSEAISGDCG